MMKRLMVWMFCLCAWTVPYAQVVLPDNMVEADCSTDVDAMDWGVVNAWSSPTIVSNLNIPLVGDLDGDGHPEIVCFSLAGQSHYANDGWLGNVGYEMLVYDGVTHQLKATVTMDSPVSEYDAASYGLVRTSDNKGLIVVASCDNRLRAYDITSATPNTPYWVSDADYTSGTNNYAANVNFVDFNGDGHPEVYVRNKIYNAENGKLLATASTTNTGASYAHYTQFTHRKLSAPFAADVCGDSRPELILGNEIYDVTITNLSGTTGNAVTLVQQVTPPGGAPTDGHVQVADFNMDGHPDVFISIKNTDAQAGTVYCYVWDVHNGQVSNALTINTNRSGKSIPLIADIDNDGMLEIVLQSGASTNRQIQAYKYNAGMQTFSLIWDMIPDEDTFSNSFTAFDFNLDGLLELIICDQTTLKIVNGSGKSHITHNDTVPVYVLNTLPYSEITIMQYPVIADVDADGVAEIVSVGSSKLNIFKSSGQPWAPARPVWNQYMYNVTNVNKDLTIPTTVFNNATTFTDPDGVVRRPFNNFLQQVTTLDQYGRPFMPLANASATADTTSTHENGVFTFTFQFCNTGSQLLTAPFYLTYYANTYAGTVIDIDTVTTMLMPDECLTWQVQFPEDILTTIPNLENIVVALNDHGQGVAQDGNQQEECVTTDNFFTFYVDPCNIPRDTVTADVCIREPYVDDNFDIPSSETQEAGTHYFSRAFQVGNCDSIIVLRLRVHPEYEVRFTETIPEGTSYDNHGIFLNESLMEGGTRIDTSIAFQSVYGCDSVIYVTIQVAAADVRLYLPNAITPSKSDGVNDGFFLPERMQSQIADFEIMIFNRWGEMVFYSTDKNFCWHGEYNGKTFYDNVYQYIIHYSNHFGKKFTVKGTVTVL
jgi:gliding motility-associated-like protein